MSYARARMDKVDNWASEHRMLVMGVFALVAAVVLVIGLTLTWFVQSQSGSTVAKVKGPAQIKVLGPNATAMAEIDLDYDDDDVSTVTDGGVTTRKVTIDRAFSVQSGTDGEGTKLNPFELYLAHTTNIAGLEIKVYRVTKLSSATGADVSGQDADGNNYYWAKKGDALSLTALNDSDADGLADEFEKTFGTYTDVEDHAKPIYSKVAVTDPDTDTVKTTEETSFIIEVSWTETEKETDVIYVVARNTGNTSASTSSGGN